ncbi:LytR/AlgR family response regulator transcription factor [Flavitalea sp.]|nr:response regulator [Flavitalea sp.]
MIKAIIIDDEPLARLLVKEYLASYPDIRVVQECNDGFEGVKAIMQEQPDLLFLDIQMPKINGFEMLELIENRPHVIFTTAFDEHAIRAFDNHAVDYLLKPFSKSRFDKAIQQFNNLHKQNRIMPTTELLETAAALPQQKARVVVKTGGKIKIIPTSAIHYLEAADDYVKIITNEGSFLKNNTMAHFEKVFSESEFVRVHRSYMVAIEQITRLELYEKEGYLAMLRSGARVPVSKAGYTKLKKILAL